MLVHGPRQCLHDVDIDRDVAVTFICHADFQHIVDLV